MDRPLVASPRRETAFVAVMTIFAALPAVACSLSWGSGAGTPSPATARLALRARNPVTAVVTSDVDGDTVHVRVGGRDERVRFIGVNSPEVAWYGGRGECFGPAAAEYTRHRLLGRTVRLVFDARLRDPYGRLLAYVYVGDELFNLTLVRLGYATNEPVPPDTRRQRLFAAAEAAARSRGEGMWSACGEA
jgi:micrococcal nuclease